METYSESAEGIKITWKRALRELADHGVTSTGDIWEFSNEVSAGEDGLYEASEVLAWLGY